MTGEVSWASAADFALPHYEEGARRTAAIFAGAEAPSSGPRPARRAELLDLLRPLSHDFVQRQFQGYVFDTLALRELGGDAHGDERLEAFAAELLGHDYLTAYCRSRGLDSQGIRTAACAVLAETQAEYDAGLADFFGPASVRQAELSSQFASHLAHAPERHSTQDIVNRLREAVGLLQLDEELEVRLGSPSGLTTNVTTLRPRHAVLYVAEGYGTEAWRGACHALGHAVYATRADEADLIGVNIGATEVAAFHAQAFALVDEPDTVQRFLQWMHLYFARLYAVRLLHDASAAEDRTSAAYASLCRELLRLEGVDAYVPRGGKLLSVDFTLAFISHLRMGQFEADWGHLRDAATWSNYTLAREAGCLAHDLAAADV